MSDENREVEKRSVPFGPNFYGPDGRPGNIKDPYHPGGKGNPPNVPSGKTAPSPSSQPDKSEKK